MQFNFIIPQAKPPSFDRRSTGQIREGSNNIREEWRTSNSDFGNRNRIIRFSKIRPAVNTAKQGDHIIVSAEPESQKALWISTGSKTIQRPV